MTAPTFDLKSEIDRATAAYLSLEGPHIPASIRKRPEPTSGPCIQCKRDTENRDEGDYICEDCLADAIKQQQSDDRHNDPRRGQAKLINGR